MPFVRFCSNALSSIGKIHLERPTVLPASVASENQTVTDCPC